MSSGDRGRSPAMSEGVMAVFCPWQACPWWVLLLSTPPSPALTSSPPATFRDFKSICGVNGKAARFSVPGARLGSLLGALGSHARSTTRETEARGQGEEEC